MNNRDHPLLFLAFLFVILAIFGIFMTIDKDFEIKKLQKQAIERNYAEYIIDSNGIVIFTWKDLSSKEE